MRIWKIWLIGSRSDGPYGDIIRLTTSGDMTHVAIMFFVSKNPLGKMPINTSIQNMNMWTMYNNIDVSGEYNIHIDEFDTNVSLGYGLYVFETNSSISTPQHSPNIIKKPGQTSGCVITPYETYLLNHKKNFVVQLETNQDVLLSLIKRFWGRPYGIDSLLSHNLNSRESMVCTHLSIRYINIVYKMNLKMFSPTALCLQVEKMHKVEDIIVDDFLNKKRLEHHYLWSLFPVVILFVSALIIFLTLAPKYTMYPQTHLSPNQTNAPIQPVVEGNPK